MSEKWIDLTPDSEVIALSDVATSVSASATDAKAPSAKCLYDLLGGVEDDLRAINGSGSGPTSYWGLHFVAEEAGAQIGMANVGSPDAVSLEYSTDGGTTWATFTPGTTTVTLAAVGDVACFRAGSGGNTKISKSDNDYRKFTLSKRCAAHGNIMSLLDGTDDETATAATMGDRCFRCLFRDCANLTSAPSLPATTLATYCYDNMFRDCTSMTVAPALPSRMTADYCYRSTFYGCTSLTTPPPSLGAVTLSPYCYSYMFQECTSLLSAPEIDATVLASSCCMQMFYNCSSLKEMPTLWASGVDTTSVAGDNDQLAGVYDNMFRGCSSLTTANGVMLIVASAYSCRSMFYGCTSITEATVRILRHGASTSSFIYMFYGCSSLSDITLHDGSWQGSVYGNPYQDWVDGVSASGTFHCRRALGTDASIERGTGYCPSGWAVENIVNEPVKFTAEEANSTVAMIKTGSPNDVSLVYSIDDGATWSAFTAGTTTVTLASVGDEMLIKAGATDNAAFCSNGGGSSNYHRFALTGRIAASGNIMSLLSVDAVAISDSYCFYGLFRNNEALTSPPELPALSLGNFCYWSMFNECSNLKTMPSLLATGLTSTCYSWMFVNCSSLEAEPLLRAGKAQSTCYNSMFKGCTSLKSAKFMLDSAIAPNENYILNNTFNGCSSLESVEMPNLKSFTTPSGNYTMTADWMANVPASGTFKCPAALGTNSTVARGASYVPNGWTVVNI